jgi:hypothetical protein
VHDLGICKLKNVWFALNYRKTVRVFLVTRLKKWFSFQPPDSVANENGDATEEMVFMYCSLPSHNPFSWSCPYHWRMLLYDGVSLLNFLLNSRCTVITDCDWQTAVHKTTSAVASPFSFSALSGGWNENHSFNGVRGKTRTVYLSFGANQIHVRLQVPKLYIFKIPISFMNNPVRIYKINAIYCDKNKK